jgi:homoserine dehydrogenase
VKSGTVFQPRGPWKPAQATQGAPRRPLWVAVAGCGAVGSALIKLLQEQNASAGANPPFELVRVLVRNPARTRPVTLDRALVTKSVDQFLATKADVVIEAINGAKPARRIALASLSAKRRYITANRALVAECGQDLLEIAAHHGAALEFGAALGGSLPVVRLLRDGACGTGIGAIRVTLDGLAGPRNSRTRQDLAERLAVLALAGFGTDPRHLVVRGRNAADIGDLGASAGSVGGVMRMLAELIHTPKGLIASVEPVIVSPRSPLVAAHGESVVAVQSRSAGTILLRGQEQGSSATASLLLADLLRDAGRPILPIAPPRSAPEDLRLHWWLVRSTEAAHDVIASFCHAHDLEQGSVTVGTGSTPRLLSVRATSRGLHELLTRLGGRGFSAQWIRWER